MRKKGVYYAEDLLLYDEKVYSLIKSSPYTQRTHYWVDIDTYANTTDHMRREIKGIKFFVDGTIGRKSAAFSEPYSDGTTGILFYSDEQLHNLLRTAVEENKPIAMHAIGDQAVAQALTAVRNIREENYDIPPIRLEHAQFIDKNRALEAKELGIILCMQPNFSDDSVVYSDRLSGARVKENNPFRMLIDEAGFESGKDLLFGSDGLPDGAEAALRHSLFPPFPNQRLTLGEFVSGYTMKDMQFGHVDLEIDNKNRNVSIVEGNQ